VFESWPKLKLGDPCPACVFVEAEPSGRPTDALEAGAEVLELPLELELGLEIELSVEPEPGLESEPEPELEGEPKLDVVRAGGKLSEVAGLPGAAG